MVQGELFIDQNAASGLGGLDRARKSFLSRYQVAMTLDKLLLISIALVIMLALTYSFGVERGKRAVEKNFESLLPDHSDTVSLNVGNSGSTQSVGNDETVILVNQNPAPISESIPGNLNSLNLPQTPSISGEVSGDLSPTVPEIGPVPTTAFPIVDLTKKGSYTIQLITYADEKQAIKEIDLLKTKGHAGFVIPSGRYYQVCANYFEDKTKAKSFLRQFSELSRYPGAYIRPVVR
jgi:hypothetical protein